MAPVKSFQIKRVEGPAKYRAVYRTPVRSRVLTLLDASYSLPSVHGRP